VTSYWLLKTEPDTYSIDDLEREGVAHWEGVRNPMAGINLRNMRVGDLALFYHSSCDPPGAAGICEVVRDPYPDHFAWDESSRYFDKRSNPDKPRWFMPDVKFVEKFERLITLKELRATPGLEDMTVVRFGRISVTPVTPGEWAIVMKLAKG
jgi:predicted RNA-binding protein with PUA-like domain